MWLFWLSLIPYVLYVGYKTKKSMQMLQQNFYNENNRYFIWIFKNFKKVWLEVDIFFPLLIIIYFIPIEIGIIVFGLFYILLLVKFQEKAKVEQNKKPLVVTPRIKRLIVMIFLMHVVAVLPVMLLCPEMIFYSYILLAILGYLNYFVVFFGNIFNYPAEKFVYHSFKRKAIKKLTNLKIPVIGITGSYGKTTSKNIINDILNVKYNVYATPKSFNTDYGLIRTINDHLDKFNDYFVAELGAFRRGDIKRLCSIVNPTIGILTIIGHAHLDTFGSRKNIQKGKFELIESLPHDGMAILNGDDEFQLNYKLKNNCTVYWIGIDNSDVDVHATNIKLSHEGTSFDVKFKDDEKLYKFKTRLLGKHNIYNILCGILLGRELGMSTDELIRGVARVSSVEHRLDVKKVGDITIIDDSYNSNPVGAKMALDILGMMPGTKIIVTPGMIELGDSQYEENKKLGEYLVKHVDYAILIGEQQTKAIYDGIMETNFPKEKVHILNDVKDAFPLIESLSNKDAYVLLENDLPDLFNE